MKRGIWIFEEILEDVAGMFSIWFVSESEKNTKNIHWYDSV